MGKIFSLVVVIDDDAVLGAIDEAVFGSLDVALDPALYQVQTISKSVNADTGEVSINVEVKPKPAPAP